MVMMLNRAGVRPALPIDVESVADLIVRSQQQSGEIPWCEGEKTDPWDHVEAAMGLSVGGHYQRAENAYEWLARVQNADGSWFSAYRQGAPEDRTRDTNMSSYVAVGTFHHFLITGDRSFLEKMWPTVKAAVNFAFGLQAPGGEVHWAVSPEGRVDPMALLTGSSSVYMSVKCALAIARRLGRDMPAWRDGLIKLGDAIRRRPHSFDMSKSRYSMDWFYPILCGAMTGETARRRLEKYWEKFVIQGQGVRCVSDRPWVTVAETCELSLALAAMGNTTLAETVFGWILNRTNADGSYWCGFTCPDMTIWPEDKSTWTNAVVLIAADAIYGLTSARRLFSHQSWKTFEFYCPR